MHRFKAKELINCLNALGKTVVAAESCTAGLVADMIARVPGASRVFWGSFICYTPDAKIRMLGVGEDTIKQFGVVSREIACEMALGALENSSAEYAVSVTGVAGPGKDSGVEAGTVWIAAARRGEKAEAVLYNLKGSRMSVRCQAANKALEEILKKVQMI